MDVKKVGKIPDGGGWKATTIGATPNPRTCAKAMKFLGAKHKLIRAHCPWQNGKVCEE
jgi:hypothetical protein